MFDDILNRDSIRIRQKIYDMVDDHVQFANSILQKQQFSMGSGSRKIIRLITRRIKVIELSLIEISVKLQSIILMIIDEI